MCWSSTPTRLLRMLRPVLSSPRPLGSSQDRYHLPRKAFFLLRRLDRSYVDWSKLQRAAMHRSSTRLRLINRGREANCSSSGMAAGFYASKGVIAMKKLGMAVCMAAGTMLLAASAFAQSEKEGQGQVIVTVMPKHSGDQAANLT